MKKNYILFLALSFLISLTFSCSDREYIDKKNPKVKTKQETKKNIKENKIDENKLKSSEKSDAKEKKLKANKKVKKKLSVVEKSSKISSKKLRAAKKNKLTKNKSSKKHSKYTEKLVGNTPKEAFYNAAQALINGDVKTAYKFRSRRIRRGTSFKQFKRDYEKWVERYGLAIFKRNMEGAKFFGMKIRGKRAEYIIEFPNGNRIVQKFIKEDGIWRDDGGVPLAD